MFVDEAQKNSPVRENRGITHQRPHQRQRRPIVLIDPILLMSKHTLRHAPRQYDHIMIGRGLAHPPRRKRDLNKPRGELQALQHHSATF